MEICDWLEDQTMRWVELKYSLNQTTHGWDDQDAQVVCRQLGLGTTGTAILGFSPSASSSVPIWLDNVICNGSESRLIDCQHNGVGNHNCDHHKDAGVTCGGS